MPGAQACRRCGAPAEHGAYCKACAHHLWSEFNGALPESMRPREPERYAAPPAPARPPHPPDARKALGGAVYLAPSPCPVCGEAVDVPKVAGSKLRPVHRHSDLFTEFHGVDPNRYWVWVCSACGFSAAHSAWTDPSGLDVRLARQAVGGLGLRRDIGLDRTLDDARTAFDQAVACAAWRRNGRGYLATLHHRRAWLERTAGDAESERQALSRALEYYQAAFESEAELPGNLDESSACYILAELYHRLGRPGNAVPWYARAVATGAGGRAWLVRLARDRWQEARRAAAGRLSGDAAAGAASAR